MALSTDIYTILRANADIVSTFATRIYPVIGPQKATYPYLVYTLTGLQPDENKTYANKWDNAFITIVVYHTNLPDAETYGQYVRTAMNRYTGTISSDLIKGVNLQSESWDAVELTETNATTGLVVFGVVSQWKIMVSQNIAE